MKQPAKTTYPTLNGGGMWLALEVRATFRSRAESLGVSGVGIVVL